MQRGSLIINNRKQGPDVWQFRWSEKGPHGKRVYRKKVIGTVERYSDAEAARRAVTGLISEINSGDLRVRSNSMTLAELGDHFEQRELTKENAWRSYSTKKIYKAYLKRWVLPHWGEYKLAGVRTIDVESWLLSLTVGQEQLRQNPKLDVCSLQSRLPIRTLRP